MFLRPAVPIPLMHHVKCHDNRTTLRKASAEEGKPGNKIEPNNIRHYPVTRQPEIDIKQPESRAEFTYAKQLELEFKTVKQPELKNRSLYSTRN